MGRRLGYAPHNAVLFEQALTHRSAGSDHNERLEFLGDAVLNLVVADYLYQRFQEADEGALSRLRASIVSGASLAIVASGLDLGDVVILGPGELKTGGFRRESILADAFEAVCGALFLDSGLEPTRPVILRLLADRLAALEAPDASKDPKTQLQEYLQARAMALPVYVVESISGADHEQHFVVRCLVEALKLDAVGEGASRRRAEQAAALKLLGQMQV